MKNLRRANVGDAEFLVPLVTESSGGVWPAIWKVYANPGESLVKTGKRYLLDDANDLHIKNTMIIEFGGKPAGAMVSYRELLSGANEDNALPDDLAVALQPFRELSDPSTLFISELCCVPESRGQGLGSQLLDHAKQTAARLGLKGVSLRVYSENVGAIRLYGRSGFKVVGERTLVPYPDIIMGGSVMLMVYEA